MLPCFRKCSHHNIGTGCWNWKWLKSYAMRQGVSMDKQENQENRSLSLKLHNENLQYLQLHQLTSSLPLWRLHQITPHDINARGTFLPLPNSISAPFPESWVWKVAKYDHLLQALGSDWKSKQGDNTVSLKYGAKWRWSNSVGWSLLRNEMPSGEIILKTIEISID